MYVTDKSFSKGHERLLQLKGEKINTVTGIWGKILKDNSQMWKFISKNETNLKLITSEHLKTCSSSLVIKEMQIRIIR